MPRDLSEVFVDYAINIKFDDLPINVVNEVKRRVLDSLGVALASYIPPSLLSTLGQLH